MWLRVPSVFEISSEKIANNNYLTFVQCDNETVQKRMRFYPDDIYKKFNII